MTDNIKPYALELKDIIKSYHVYDSRLKKILDLLGLHHFIRYKKYGYVGEKSALSNINLKILRGEKVGIIGRNGSGKTTLLKLAIGHIKPTKGKVLLHGSANALMESSFGFNDELTGIENIKDGLSLINLSEAEKKKYIKDIVDFSELASVINYPVRTYSKGMRMRLEYATATAISPDILIIDEVLGAGDGYFAKKCAKRMHELINDTTLILVSHSMNQIIEYCDRVIWIDEGEVVEDGDVSSVINSYKKFIVKQDNQGGSIKKQPKSIINTNVEHELSSEFNLNRISRVSEGILKDLVIKSHRNNANELPKLASTKFTKNKNSHYAIETGDPLSITLEITIPDKWSGSVRPVIFGLSEDGKLIWDGYGEKLSFEYEEASKLSVELICKQFFTGVGNYFLNIALQDGSATSVYTKNSIIDVSYAGLYLKLMPTNYSDPPLFHCPAEWQYGGVKSNKHSSRINAWV